MMVESKIYIKRIRVLWDYLLKKIRELLQQVLAVDRHLKTRFCVRWPPGDKSDVVYLLDALKQMYSQPENIRL